MPRPQEAVLLWSLTLDGGQLTENVGHILLLLLHLLLRVTDDDLPLDWYLLLRLKVSQATAAF